MLSLFLCAHQDWTKLLAMEVGFLNVKLPAGRHPVVVQPRAVWRHHNRHARRVGQHIAAEHDARIVAQGSPQNCLNGIP